MQQWDATVIRSCISVPHRKVGNGIDMLRPLSKVQAENPSFRPGWIASDTNTSLINPRFGQIDHVAVCDADQRPLYDQPIWIEGVGAICIPVAPDGRLTLIRQHRHVLTDIGTVYIPSEEALGQLGRDSWELPRGFPEKGETPEQAAARETSEETGAKVLHVEIIDYVNANTTYHPNSAAVALVHITPTIGNSAGDHAYRSPEKTESIDLIRQLTLDEVLQWTRDQKLYCGMTKAALFSYIAWLNIPR